MARQTQRRIAKAQEEPELSLAERLKQMQGDGEEDLDPVGSDYEADLFSDGYGQNGDLRQAEAGETSIESLYAAAAWGDDDMDDDDDDEEDEDDAPGDVERDDDEDDLADWLDDDIQDGLPGAVARQPEAASSPTTARKSGRSVLESFRRAMSQQTAQPTYQAEGGSHTDPPVPTNSAPASATSTDEQIHQDTGFESEYVDYAEEPPAPLGYAERAFAEPEESNLEGDEGSEDPELDESVEATPADVDEEEYDEDWSGEDYAEYHSSTSALDKMRSARNAAKEKREAQKKQRSAGKSDRKKGKSSRRVAGVAPTRQAKVPTASKGRKAARATSSGEGAKKKGLGTRKAMNAGLGVLMVLGIIAAVQTFTRSNNTVKNLSPTAGTATSSASSTTPPASPGSGVSSAAACSTLTQVKPLTTSGVTSAQLQASMTKDVAELASLSTATPAVAQPAGALATAIHSEMAVLSQVSYQPSQLSSAQLSQLQSAAATATAPAAALKTWSSAHCAAA
ncbi:MAG: hypothetical protein M0Z91_13635 [Actinomycetota bacterium]|nr:hypothetical protein [Actinomycetota bacterium]